MTGHRTEFSKDGWAFWRIFQVRTSGFSSSLVLGLADSECASLADELDRSSRDLDDLWDLVRHDLAQQAAPLFVQEEISPDGETISRSRYRTPPVMRALEKARNKGVLSDELGQMISPELRMALAEATDRCARSNSNFRACFTRAELDLDAFLERVANDSRFREAVAWQNKSVIPLVLDPVANLVPRRRKGIQRKGQKLVASYLQRYCTKNDTISFFGPVNWGNFSDKKEGYLSVQREAENLVHRRVYFEDWAIHALAEHLSSDSRFSPWMVPKAAPYIYLDGLTLRLPAGGKTVLSPEEAAVLKVCNGVFTARELAASLLINHPSLFGTEDKVFSILNSLAQARRIYLGFIVRLHDASPENYLRDQLAKIDDLGLRQEALSRLDDLEKKRQKVADAAGRPQNLLNALHELDTTFEQVAGSSPLRNTGQTYGARTIAYEDCLGGAEVTLGAEFLSSLQQPLDLIFTSSRWFCYRIASIFQKYSSSIFERLKAAQGAAGAPSIDFPTFWLHAQAFFQGDDLPDVARLQVSLTERWQSILQVGEAKISKELKSDQIRAEVVESFPTQGGKWGGALYHSPDLMIAARSISEIENGNFLFVLGEVHSGLNTILVNAITNQHPDSMSLFDGLRFDSAAPRIIPIVSREGSQLPMRTRSATDTRRDIELCFSFDGFPLNASNSIDIADLLVERKNGELQVRSRDGRYVFSLLEVFGHMLSLFVADRFRILPRGKDLPRITIDRCVINRRTWHVPCAELQPLLPGDDATQFLQLRRWSQKLGIPRWIFAKMSWEVKPVYLDMDSPLSVRMLKDYLKKGTTAEAGERSYISFSEMLPSHEHLWMPFGGGQRCTSELRFAAIHRDDTN